MKTLELITHFTLFFLTLLASPQLRGQDLATPYWTGQISDLTYENYLETAQIEAPEIYTYILQERPSYCKLILSGLINIGTIAPLLSKLKATPDSLNQHTQQSSPQAENLLSFMLLIQALSSVESVAPTGLIAYATLYPLTEGIIDGEGVDEVQKDRLIHCLNLRLKGEDCDFSQFKAGDQIEKFTESILELYPRDQHPQLYHYLLQLNQAQSDSRTQSEFFNHRLQGNLNHQQAQKLFEITRDKGAHSALAAAYIALGRPLTAAEQNFYASLGALLQWVDDLEDVWSDYLNKNLTPALTHILPLHPTGEEHNQIFQLIARNEKSLLNEVRNPPTLLRAPTLDLKFIALLIAKTFEELPQQYNSAVALGIKTKLMQDLVEAPGKVGLDLIAPRELTLLLKNPQLDLF